MNRLLVQKQSVVIGKNDSCVDSCEALGRDGSEAGDLGSSPSSASNLPRDLGQVTAPLRPECSHHWDKEDAFHHPF